MTRIHFLLPAFLLLFPIHSNAQGKLGVFVGVGTMFYEGDLVESFIVPAPTVSWTVDAGLHWQINRRWGLQLNYTVGDIKGDDGFALNEGRQTRGFSFQSFVHELSLRGTYDILRNDKWKFLPYLTAGVGALYTDLSPGATNAATIGQEGTISPITVSFPVGVGVKYQISCPWVLKAEGLYHFTMSDHLDGVSHRGSPTMKDGIWDINIGVIWFFTGCRSKKGGIIEDCERLNRGVDMDKLMKKYGQ